LNHLIVGAEPNLEYAHEYHSSDEVEEYDMDCDECMGTGIGYPVDFPCSCCGGTGMVKVRQEDCDYNPDYN